VKLDLPRGREFEAGVWYSTHASTWYPTHYHDELELKIVLWGETVYNVGSQQVTLGPGTQLWLAPGQQHTLLEVSDDLAMWVTSFREDAVRNAERDAGLRVLDGQTTWGVCKLPAARLQILSKLSSDLTLEHQPAAFNDMAHRLLVEALGSWNCSAHGARLVATTAGKTGALHPAVAQAVTLLRELDEDLSLGRLAQRCGLSAARLSRLFKQQMGLSLVQYRTHFRVQRFISRFGRGDGENMLAAALRAGFGSYPQFHRAFWQVTGYAPSEHLRRVRSGVVVPAQQGAEARLSLLPSAGHHS
jgi:AraC-like DNA-binding protein